MQPLFPYWEPLAIPIGPLTVHGFGILVAIGFVVGAQIAMGKARRDGLDPDFINRVVGWLVLGVFVGGHLGHMLFYYPDELLEDPTKLFRVWEGLSSFGGFIACAILVIWFYWNQNRKRGIENLARQAAGKELLPRLHGWGFADALIYGFTVGWFFGRMGCFAAHDHPGLETSFWLAVPGTCPGREGDTLVACHDLGLYEAIWSIAMYGLFLALDRKPRFPGFFVAIWCLSYGPARLVMDFFRHPAQDTRYFGMTPAQFGSLALIGLGLAIWARRRHEPPLRG
jgi:phosphatidylglycerol---prolipoprotein diacylglyceryl transferase